MNDDHANTHTAQGSVAVVLRLWHRYALSLIGARAGKALLISSSGLKSRQLKKWLLLNVGRPIHPANENKQISDEQGYSYWTYDFLIKLYKRGMSTNS